MKKNYSKCNNANNANLNANPRIANMKNFSNLIYPELSYKIVGILFIVHNELGRFCNERQYADAIERYFEKI